MKIVQVNEVPEAKDNYPKCPACGSKKVTKSGKHYNMNNTRQRYGCKHCGISFSKNGYFGYKAKYPLFLKTLAIQLYLSGLSLRDVADEINKSYGVTVSDCGIWRWLKKAGVCRKDPQTKKTKTKYNVHEVVAVSVSTLVRFSSSYIPEKMIMLSDKINLQE